MARISAWTRRSGSTIIAPQRSNSAHLRRPWRANDFNVQPGHMGDRTYLRHGEQPRAERVVEGLQGSLLQIDVSEILAHKAEDPNSVVDLLDADALAGKHGGDVDLLSMHADAAAGGDENVAVVEGICNVWQPGVGPVRGW